MGPWNLVHSYIRDTFRCLQSMTPILQWHHNERNGISNQRRLHRLLSCWFRRRSKIAKNSNVEILQEMSLATQLLKLLDKMYKYEMDPSRTVGATEQMLERQMDGRADGRTEWNQYTPQQLRCAAGIMTPTICLTHIDQVMHIHTCIYTGEMYHHRFQINTLQPSGIWQHRYRWTLPQGMACCLVAPSHYMYLNQYWLQWGPVIFIWGKFHKRYLSQPSH